MLKAEEESAAAKWLHKLLSSLVDWWWPFSAFAFHIHRVWLGVFDLGWACLTQWVPISSSHSFGISRLVDKRDSRKRGVCQDCKLRELGRYTVVTTAVWHYGRSTYAKALSDYSPWK